VAVIAVAIVIAGVVLVAVNSSGDSSQAQLAGTPDDDHGEGIPYPAVQRIAVADAHAMAQNGEAVIVDVRDQAEYQAEHIAGALGLPERELANRLGELPREQLIITYCA
jgi:3-mercaptopyruvate sulfurtransferase SseA